MKGLQLKAINYANKHAFGDILIDFSIVATVNLQTNGKECFSLVESQKSQSIARLECNAARQRKPASQDEEGKCVCKQNSSSF